MPGLAAEKPGPYALEPDSGDRRSWGDSGGPHPWGNFNEPRGGLRFEPGVPIPWMRLQGDPMSDELQKLSHRIEVSRRIIEREPYADEDPIVHSMIVEELKREVPDLEARRRFLERGEERA